MTLDISVVVPVYNGARMLGSCLEALSRQALAKDRYEIIVVDDGSVDDTVATAKAFGVRLLEQAHAGEAAARNLGTRESNAKWIAFTDADCIPTRRWLEHLLIRVEREWQNGPVLGVAGQIIGSPSNSPTARYTEMSGSLKMEIHLNHPVFPYAPFTNAMYARDCLISVGGIDERFRHYPAPDLHHRLIRMFEYPFYFEPKAVVLHQHRSTWSEYWRQQYGYGVGYAQFLLLYKGQIPWDLQRELAAWAKISLYALQACIPNRGDVGLFCRGRFIQQLAQRLGFARTYWDKNERRIWEDGVANRS
ncbi:MAG: glycosyltransferase [Anaerolineales bacterium]